jgi:hypothetical protein
VCVWGGAFVDQGPVYVDRDLLTLCLCVVSQWALATQPDCLYFSACGSTELSALSPVVDALSNC